MEEVLFISASIVGGLVGMVAAQGLAYLLSSVVSILRQKEGDR